MSCCPTATPSSCCTPAQQCYPENFGLDFPSLVGPMGPPGGPGTFVENYDALRALDASVFTAGYVAWVSGYDAINDGGQGNFQYDPLSASADDDGTVLSPVNGIGRWKRIYDPSAGIFLVWFGIKIGDVVGNGLFNDAACLAAVNIAKVSGNTVVAPAGTIVISTHFPIRNPTVPPVSLLDYNGITVIGQGRSTTFKQQDATGDGADVFNLNGVKNVNLLNFTITSEIDTGVSVSGTNAVSIVNGGENILCRRIHADKMPYKLSGADFDGGAAFTIQHSSNALNDRNIQFIECSGEGDPITQCGAYAINFQFDGASQITNPPQGVVVKNCTFRTMYRGVLAQLVVGGNVSVAPQMQVEITGNQFAEMQQAFIMYGMTGLTFADNQFSTSFVGAAGFNPADTAKFGWALLSNYNCVVTGNVLKQTEGDYFATIGGGATGDAATPTDQCVFSNNAFIGDATAAYGILGSTTESYGYTTNSYFTNNTFNGAPSTGNMDLSFYRAELSNVVIDGETAKIPTLRGLQAISGPNSVTNGTAWTGATGATPPTGWSVAIAGVYTIFDSGDGSPYDICLKQEINGASTANAFITFSAPTAIGRRYAFDYAFKNGTAVAGSAYVGSSVGASDLYDSGNLTNTVWAIRRAVFTATTTTTTIGLINRGSVAGETVLWDSVSLSEIPLSVDGNVVLTGGLTSSSVNGVGYATGAGGTVVQATSKSTTVYLQKACGEITMNSAALAADAIVSFVLINPSIAAGDLMLLNHISGGTIGKYHLNAQCAAGYATVNVTNISAGPLSEAIVIRFAIIKGVNS